MKGGYSDRPCQVLYRRSDPLDWIVGGFITNVVVPEGGYMRALGLVHLLFYYPIFYRLHSNRESSGIEAAWTDELEYKINIDIRLALIAIHSLLSPRLPYTGITMRCLALAPVLYTLVVHAAPAPQAFDGAAGMPTIEGPDGICSSTGEYWDGLKYVTCGELRFC